VKAKGSRRPSKSSGWDKVRGGAHLLWLIFRKFGEDHGFFLSSGITFNLLICFVPLMLLLLALVGTYLYSDREVLHHLRRSIESAVPTLDPRIMKNILTIIRDRKIVGVLGIGGLIWTSTWVFSSLRTALNVILQAEKERGILRGKAVDLLMVFLAGLFLWVSMTLTSSITLLQGYRISPYLGVGVILRFVLKYFLPFFFTFWMAFFTYKIIPNRKILSGQPLCCPLPRLMWEVASNSWICSPSGKVLDHLWFIRRSGIFFIWIYYSSVILLLEGRFS
jgi:YihY family inner membrane protein